MTASRTKYTILNSAFGFLVRIIALLAAFVTRSIFIRTLGIQYAGLSGVFTDILVVLSFAELGIDLEFVGEGVNEKGIDKATGKTLIEVDPRYFRPAEVDLLLGDSSKARRELGWMPKYDLPMLVKEMVQSDLELAKKEKTLREHGYKVLIPQEV